MRVTVFGPNLPRNDHGTFHVHRTGCADTKRGIYRHIKYGGDQGGWGLDVSSDDEVIQEIYPPGDFDYDPKNPDEYTAYENDVTFFPCIRFPKEGS